MPQRLEQHLERYTIVSVRDGMERVVGLPLDDDFWTIRVLPQTPRRELTK